MKTITVIISILITQLAFAQDHYHKAMEEVLSLWGNRKTEEAMFKIERIASVETDNWIPRYYQALIACTYSFQTQDIQQKKALLQITNKLIPEDKPLLNAEWYILKATALTSELTIDPMNNAVRLSPLIIVNYEKAIALEPNNPRAISGLAIFQIRSKNFSGGNTDQDYKNLQKALSLFQTEKNTILFYPSWGKEQTEKMLKNHIK